MIFPQNYLHLLVHVFKHLFNQVLISVSYIIRPEILCIPTNRMLFRFSLYLEIGFGLSLLSLLLYWLNRCALSPKPTVEMLTKFWHYLEPSRHGANMLLVARLRYQPQTKGRKPHANNKRLVTLRYLLVRDFYRTFKTEDIKLVTTLSYLGMDLLPRYLSRLVSLTY